MDKRTRSRLQLLLVASLFAAPVVISLALNAAGWRPHGTRNFGELVTPPQDVSAIALPQTDGSAFVWRDPHWQWTLLAVAGSSCDSACQAQLDLLHRARLTLNQNADRVRLVYLGPPLPPPLLQQLQPLTVIAAGAAALPVLPVEGADTLAAGLVDPNGFLMLRYTAGFDANGLKKDLTRLIH